MAGSERKSLVWDIRKGLLVLSPDQLFEIANDVGTVPGKDLTELSSGDAEGCFEYINSFMYSKSLLEAEDSGMGELLALKDKIDDVLNIPGSPGGAIETNVGTASPPVFAPPPLIDTNQPVLVQTSTDVGNANVSHEVQKIMSDYEMLSQKLHDLVKTPIVQHVPEDHPPIDSMKLPTPTPVVSLRDLPYLPRREFKVQGGQIGDHASDISYNSVCRQIEEGVKDNFKESEIVRGVLKIIKPGDFKDMLVNKEDMTIAELKGFLQSHLGERNSTELFQELICAKQKENETTQQFLYRVIGLKQRIVFESKQSESEIKYSPDTVQGVFLHTVYQGIGHKDNDIRRELKPLLADQAVTDETILKHVMRVTSEEYERQRRLGSNRPKHINAHVAHTDEGKTKQPKKETTESKAKTDTVKQLSDKIDALTKLVDTLTETVQKRHYNAPTKTHVMKNDRTYACPKCVQEGSQNCNHCFSCGEEGHRAVGCMKRPKQQGNESRLLRRDKR